MVCKLLFYLIHFWWLWKLETLEHINRVLSYCFEEFWLCSFASDNLKFVRTKAASNGCKRTLWKKNSYGIYYLFTETPIHLNIVITRVDIDVMWLTRGHCNTTVVDEFTKKMEYRNVNSFECAFHCFFLNRKFTHYDLLMHYRCEMRIFT